MNTDKIFKIYNRLNWIWIFPFFIFTLTSMLCMYFAIPAIYEMEKLHPDLFAGHRYINYNTINQLMPIWVLSSMAFSIFGVLSLMTHNLTSKRQTRRTVE